MVDFDNSANPIDLFRTRDIIDTKPGYRASWDPVKKWYGTYFQTHNMTVVSKFI